MSKITVANLIQKPPASPKPSPQFHLPNQHSQPNQTRLKKPTLHWRASAVLQLWDFDTSHNLHLITQQKTKTSSTWPEMSKDSLYICSLETSPNPNPNPPTHTHTLPVPTRAFVQCWRWLAAWRSASRRHSSASDSGSHGPVCLPGLGMSSFFLYLYIYIYIKIEKYAHTL